MLGNSSLGSSRRMCLFALSSATASQRSLSPRSTALILSSLRSSSSSSSSSVSTPVPLVRAFDSFLRQIQHHGQGEVSLRLVPGARVAEVHINNPTKRNCLSGRMIYQLMTTIDSLSSDEKYASTVAVVLRGAGSDDNASSDHPPAFCAGLDFSLAKEVVNSPEQGLMMSKMMTEALNRLRGLDMISVALLHGHALGGGAELTTACDFRLMTDTAISKVGFVHARLAASPGWGGGRRLVQIVGRQHALRLLGTAQVLSAQEAVEVNLVDALLTPPTMCPTSPSSSYMEQVLIFLQPFTNMPYPRAVKDLKGLVGGLSDCAGGVADRNMDVNLEQSVFKKRWGSADNKDALSSK